VKKLLSVNSELFVYIGTVLLNVVEINFNIWNVFNDSSFLLSRSDKSYFN
jgi:MFS-type transporter involved in bile tolerance (Atg22 family)